MAKRNAILSARDLRVEFGGVKAADGVNLDLYAGDMASIIGPNGSGKTTFLNLCTGYIRPTAGRVNFGPVDLTALSPRKITRLGIVRTFQLPQLFTEQSVIDNVLVALSSRNGFWTLKRMHHDETYAEAEELLATFGLEEHAHRDIVSLPEGVRKLADIALALAISPKILLMDEPTSGVSSLEKFAIMDTLTPILRERKITALVVEHDMELIERYMDRVIVWNAGQVVGDGTPATVLNDADVVNNVIGVL